MWQTNHNSYPTVTDVYPTIDTFITSYQTYYNTSIYRQLTLDELKTVYLDIILIYGNETFKFNDVRKCEYSLIHYLNHNYVIYKDSELFNKNISNENLNNLIKTNQAVFSSMENPDNDNITPDETDMPYTSKKSINTNTTGIANTIRMARGAIRIGLHDQFLDGLKKECFQQIYIGDNGGLYIEKL